MGVMKRIAAALVVLALTGCEVRLDEPDPSPAPPSAAEEIRQREALRAAAFAELAQSDDGVLGTLGAHASVQVEALGGVWVPWPDGGAPETPPPAPVADISPTDAASALEALASTTPEVCDAAVGAAEADDALVYGSICLARRLDRWALAESLGEPGPVVAALPEAIGTSDPGLVRALDAAAYALDVHAANARAGGDDAGSAAHATRAAEFRYLAISAVDANGWAGTDADPREPFYDITALPSPAEIEADLARAFVAALAVDGSRPALLAAAFTCAAAARAGGVDLGALPGIE